MDFFYDTNGHPYALNYNDTTYYYITNLQGDVIYLVDEDGETVASYEYDPYGNILSATGDMAEINPLRYRGYYYDAELEMYYLQSRYYDPMMGRFINADEVLMVGSSGTVNGYNLFAYCENNPIMKYDPCGYFSIPRGVISFAIDAVIWAVFSAGAAAWTTAMQPVKAMARVWGKELIKAKLKGILSGFSSTLAKIIIKVSAKLVPVVKNAVGWLFRKWAAALTAEKLAATIAGGLLSLTSNTFLNAIVPNIDVFLSVGGLVSGLWDYMSDKKFDKKITLW